MATTKGQRLQFDLDDDDLKLFCEEADEQIELLDASLVQLEGDPDPDLVQQIFRAAHTLKGSSATIGHKKMANLTHAMETVLDAVRQGRKSANAEMVDALLAGLDALRELAREVVTRVDSGIATAALEADLLATLEADDPDTQSLPSAPAGAGYQFSDASVQAALAEMGQGSSCYFVEVSISPDCQLPSIRCFQVLQELDALGTTLQTWPDRDVVEAGAGEFALTAALLSRQSDEQLQAAVEVVMDVGAVHVRSVPAEALGRPMTAHRAPAAAAPASTA